MRKLLIPLLAALALPTAVNANPFSGDIVEKNALGEKIIVKKTTVDASNTFRVKDKLKLLNESPASWDYFVKQMQGYQKEWESKYSNCLLNEKESWCNLVQKYPETIKDYQDEAAKYESYKNEAENRIKEFAPKYKNFNLEEIIYIKVKYTPIFENINKIKVVQPQAELKCWNESIDFSPLGGKTKGDKLLSS